MPFFSRRKSGKQKVNKHVPGQESSKAQTNTSQKLKQSSNGASFNGITTTPDLSCKSLYQAAQRPANSTAKCVANFPRRSRLSKSLSEVLVDDSILPLFLEFLHRQGAQNVLNFWLSAETFRLSSRDKNLFSYKSRVKLKSKQQSASEMEKLNIQNDSRQGSPAFEMETNESSSQTNLQSSPGFSSSGTNGCNLGSLKPGNSESRQTTVDKPDTGRSKTGSEISKAVFTPSSSSTKNKSLFDSSHKEFSIYNSMNTNSTLPGLSEDNNSRLGLPVNIEHSPCTDVSRKTVLVTNDSNDVNSSSQEDLNLNNRNKNETSNSDENATRISQWHDKNELTRQESRETRERRRMSKVMIDDALSIYRHFISLEATQPLDVDENIRREVESNICTENGVIHPECFNVAQKFAFNTLQNRYFDDFIRSSYYQKHIMDILTSGKVFLADVMYNDSAMFYFMEFMEQEEKSYLLAFWIAVDSFCQELQSKLDKKEYNADEALEDAMVLYDKYFSMQASNSLGVSDETRIRIENKICREEGPLPDCFEEPMENVLTLLEEVYFPIFLDSDVYMKYLNELFSAVTDVDSDHTSVDDCSSTTSVNETSKLMESLVDDVEPHDDPDEIWQRPHFGLSIGRVNEFGIYEPGIEPQPGKEALKFGQKMKKLVSGDSDKMKEEMAWKVAKMVLEDVKKQQKKAR